MLYCSWDIARDRCNCYFSFWVIFYPFIPHAPSPPNSPKNENFKKKRKKHHEISSFNTSVPKIMIILRYGVWQMQLLFFILGYFLPFYPPKSENFKKIKKNNRRYHFTELYQNHDHMLYCSWDMARDGCNCYFSFWAIVCPYTPITAQKMKISQKWLKKH